MGPVLAAVGWVPLLLVGGVAEAMESEAEWVDVSLVGLSGAPLSSCGLVRL